jgi:hypothetical protein
MLTHFAGEVAEVKLTHPGRCLIQGGSARGTFPLAAPFDYVDLVLQDGACSQSVDSWVQKQIEMEE